MSKKWLIGGGIFLLTAVGVGFAIKKLYFDKKHEEPEEVDKDEDDGYQGDFEDDEEEEDEDDIPIEVNPEPKPEPEPEPEIETEPKMASSYMDYKSVYDDEDEEEDPDLSDMDLSEEHDDDSGKQPEIIDGSSLGELSNRWDQETLYFYQENGAIVDESMTELKDPMRFVGSTIEDSGFVDDDNLMLFVKNYQLDTVYTIQKIKGAWADE